MDLPFRAAIKIHPTRHRWMTFILPAGTPVLAPAGGLVLRVARRPSGWTVIQHDGLASWLGGLDSVSVKAGEQVNDGQQIGASGSMLRWGVREGREWADPLWLIYGRECDAV